MKKKLLPITVLLLAVIFSLSSCMVSYHPAFAPGHYNHRQPRVYHAPPPHLEHHEKSNHHRDEASLRLKQIDNINMLKTISTDDLQIASADDQLQPIENSNEPTSLSFTPNAQQKEKTSASESVSVQKNPVIIDAVIANDKNNSTTESKNNSTKAVAHSSGDNQLICAVIAFFIPPLGVVLYEHAITINFWVDLILTLLFWLPGFIFALIVILG